jgi:hypothetical protein
VSCRTPSWTAAAALAALGVLGAALSALQPGDATLRPGLADPLDGVGKGVAAPCDGCDPWTQGPLDLDPGPAATAEVHLAGPGWTCPASLRVDLAASLPGTCGPGVGTSCSTPIDPCAFTATLTYSAPPNVLLLFNDGTYGTGLVWQILRGGCAPRVETRQLQRQCGTDSFLWILAWDTVTNARAFDFVTLGCTDCPPPD